MSAPAPLKFHPLGFPWPTQDPFLFCVHHDDRYPAGNGRFGPAAASLAGRQIGSDFSCRDGWSMYHGQTVPGFPAHPHRGFETVTLVRTGRIDHADSVGAAARYGDGDVQWLTAGRGIQHAEMFPLLSTSAPNPLDLFQIWLNLPARSKFAAPHFTMLWAEAITRRTDVDAAGRRTELLCVAGAPDGMAAPPSPPPDSWASDPAADVAIWTLKLDAGARMTLPAARGGAATKRRLYFFLGDGLRIADQPLPGHCAVDVPAERPVEIVNTGTAPAELLMLQGRPIGEPVAQYGPFVMNTEAEIRQAFMDYQRTQFGGWPWPDTAPVHGTDPARFARHTDGRTEQPPA
ncbi:pirin family protein [Sphaerotilus sp.]|uniref:pirin family protein n=1 Tax=Sphaerotilus sp. TaxID=2093942 RepID=UPI002ACED330|nr:pirin family protein [Sphaerotilus sp.]MDZ7857951.1 pirin family protein [Sphaerotilus sp.]